ncbi:MAG: hypothetical protein AB7U60_05475 [Diaphorobacter sp.]
MSAFTFQLLIAGISHAASARQAQNAGGPTVNTGKKSKSAKVKPQQNNSAESTSERDRRLYRECRGMPNAGACLGYTRR